MPYRPKVMMQTERDILVLQVGGWALEGYEDSRMDSDLEHGMLEQCSDLGRNVGTGMLRGCRDAGTGDRQRIEWHGGGELKWPRPKFGCNGTDGGGTVRLRKTFRRSPLDPASNS